MRALRLAAAALAALGATAGSARAAIQDGPDGRSVLGGTWLFRLDPRDEGLARHYERSASTRGWERVRVPSAWNAADDSHESMRGGVGWYRKDFELPDRDAALRWLVRFESINYRARVWLNGRPIGRHRGAYLPFELALRGVKRTGTNRLVVRVDSRRLESDFPPATINSEGVPTGGWFNASGIIREVALRRVRGVDMQEVEVRPDLPCARCDARVTVRVRLRGADRTARTVAVSGSFGRRRFRVGTARVPAGGTRVVATRFTVRDPRLWSPAHPNLYRVRLQARSGGRVLAGHTLSSGVRSVRVSRGRLYLNGRPTSLRGMGFHEEVYGRGMALTTADREWLVDEAKALGATMMRTHYPPGADLHELADRKGMLLWSEVPVYSMRASHLARRRIRRLALEEVRRNIVANRNHPSVAIWSIGNELSPTVGPTQAAYIRDAVALAHELDPSRPVGLAIFGYPSSGCQPEYGPLEVIGVNDYFGWYPGPGGELFDRTRLTDYLDQVRACYPNDALMVTEFGAEANREGPVEEKGTWGFQQEFVDYHLSVFATKPWLSGALYWAMNEFRVRPGWAGGNPRPQPPMHQKGLVTYQARERKPAWEHVRRWYMGEAGHAPYPAPR